MLTCHKRPMAMSLLCCCMQWYCHIIIVSALMGFYKQSIIQNKIKLKKKRRKRIGDNATNKLVGSFFKLVVRLIVKFNTWVKLVGMG